MKKLAVLKFILVALIFFQGLISYSQNLQDFGIRYDNKNIRGDILLIGNNILNRDGRWKYYLGYGWTKGSDGDRPNVPYNGEKQNGSFHMDYIDIDGDPDTFNSSSATLSLQDPACSKIVSAELYWAAVKNGTKRIDKVKFKMPGKPNYIDINGKVIYKEKNSFYASYADVTKYFTGSSRPDPNGEYTVANISTAEGFNGGTGLSAGWSLFIVYENANLPEKAITSFEGFSAIDKWHSDLGIEVSGFTTNPVGPVRATFAFSALEGDLDLEGDFLKINGVKVKIQERPENNFFNSSITSLGKPFTDRKPNSSNTLGFDAGVFRVPNGGDSNSVIKNGATSATISLGSSDDVYYYYFNAFAIEIITPRIVMVEKVKAVNDSGNEYDANGQIIEPGKEIRYEITFENKGNDDAVNFTITDIMPANVVFDAIKTKLPKGVTIGSYDPATRTIVFNIDSSLVKAKGGVQTMQFIAKTTTDCDSMIDACSNVVQNTATSSYTGVVNKAVFGSGTLAADEGCSVGVPAPVTFSIGRDKCKFEKRVFLCGGGVVLKAGKGYTNYVWKDSNGTVFGENNQEVTVIRADTYTVDATSSTCSGITQTFYVSGENPLNKFADNIDPSTNLPYTCTIDGKPFPKIFLCGKDAKKDIDTKITGATSISWEEKRNAPSAGLDDDCPDKNAPIWASVSTESKYTVDKAGAYRLVVTSGTADSPCVNAYYFNVTKTEPAFTKQDVVCDTKGSITITKPKPTDRNGYEYSLDGVAYQALNVFNNIETGTHKVYIRPKSINTRFENCEYIAEVTIAVDPTSLNANLTLTTPLTDCNVGEITVSATNGVEPYSYYVDGSTTALNSTKILARTAKIYTVKVLDSNNCETTATITVSKIPGPTTTPIKFD